MGVTDDDHALEATRHAARLRGRDFVIRSYEDFDVRFIECVHPGCGWTEYLSVERSPEDLLVKRALRSHARTHASKKDI